MLLQCIDNGLWVLRLLKVNITQGDCYISQPAFVSGSANCAAFGTLQELLFGPAKKPDQGFVINFITG